MHRTSIIKYIEIKLYWKRSDWIFYSSLFDINYEFNYEDENELLGCRKTFFIRIKLFFKTLLDWYLLHSFEAYKIQCKLSRVNQEWNWRYHVKKTSITLLMTSFRASRWPPCNPSFYVIHLVLNMNHIKKIYFRQWLIMKLSFYDV